jgi:hypothetical protein
MSLFAVIVIVVVVIVYGGGRQWIEGYVSQEVDGENANNHSCVKLMKTFPLFKDKFDSWNKNKFKTEAQNVAYSLSPSMSDMYMESDVQTVMKGACIIPEQSMPSYNLTMEVNGNEKRCKGESENGKVSVVLPYIDDKVSGCGLVFNNYDAKRMENVLLDLHYLSTEHTEKVKEKARARVAPLKNTVNAFNNLNNTLNVQTTQYSGLVNRMKTKVDLSKSSLDKANLTTSHLQAANADLKAKFASTW